MDALLLDSSSKFNSPFLPPLWMKKRGFKRMEANKKKTLKIKKEVLITAQVVTCFLLSPYVDEAKENEINPGYPWKSDLLKTSFWLQKHPLIQLTSDPPTPAHLKSI